MAVEQAASHGAAGDLLFDGFILLGAALLLVLFFRRFGLGAVLGYILAGVLVGPHGLGLIDNGELILGFAEIGIVLLLFIVGLELAPARLWRLRKEIFGLGLMQVVVCGLAVTGLVLFAAGFTWAAALAIGLPLGLSSTAQVLPLLQSEGRLNTPVGERAFSILMFQDLSVVPLLTIVAALSRAPVDPGAPPGWLLTIYAALAIAGLVLAGRYLLNPLLRIVGHFAERELFVVAGLFTVFAAGALMGALGLSTALGAFVAGVMLADSPYRHELQADIDPFRSILLGLFFLAIGMLLDVEAILSRPFFVIGTAAALVATKIALIFGIGKLFGMANRQALVLGLLLSQGGEFAFVIYTEAQRALLIADEAASVFGAVVTISMMATPFLMALSRRFGGVTSASEASPGGPEAGKPGGAIVVGYGRFGQTVSQMLMGANIPVTLIDSKSSQIEISEQFGRKVYYGDGTRVDLLREAGAEHARAILFCQDDAKLDAEKIATIRKCFPEAVLVARVFDRRQLIELDEAAVDGVVREVFESAVAMAHEAMDLMDLDEWLIERVEEEYRKRDHERLRAQLKAGDLHAGAELAIRGPESIHLERDKEQEIEIEEQKEQRARRHPPKD